MDVDTTKKSPAILSFCTGMRGLERGVERVIGRLDVKCYVEIEAFIIENLVSQMEQGFLDPAPVWSNLKTFNPEPFRGKVDGIVGGYPCQGFSVAGLQKGTEDPRHLWPYIKAHIHIIRPTWCFFENVANHLNIGYETVRGELQELGYHVEEGIYSAEEVGAPHRRERLFILAILADAESGERGLLLQSGQSRFDHDEFVGAGETKLALAEGTECERSWDSRTGRNGFTDFCEKLGNPQHNGLDPTTQRRGTIETGTYDKEGKDISSEFKGTGGREISRDLQAGEGDVANTNNSRSGENIEPGQLRSDGTKQSSGNGRPSESKEGIERSQGNRWPARPGEIQYEWEQPRVESKMGVTANGYNFREDLLRMAGNGVIPAQAECAFRDLLAKHQKRMLP